MKADDVITRDVPFCQEQLNRDLVVITQDTELIHRCKQAAQRSGGNELTIVKPLFFLGDLENIVGENLSQNIIDSNEEQVDTSTSTSTSTSSEKITNSVRDDMTSEMELEITLGARLIAAESQLRSKGRNKKQISTSK